MSVRGAHRARLALAPLNQPGEGSPPLLVVVAILLLDPTQDLILHRHSGRGRPNLHLAVKAVGNQHVELARWLARRRPGVLWHARIIPTFIST